MVDRVEDGGTCTVSEFYVVGGCWGVGGEYGLASRLWLAQTKALGMGGMFANTVWERSWIQRWTVG